MPGEVSLGLPSWEVSSWSFVQTRIQALEEGLGKTIGIGEIAQQEGEQQQIAPLDKFKQVFNNVYPRSLPRRRELSHDVPFNWEGADGEKSHRNRKKASQKTNAT